MVGMKDRETNTVSTDGLTLKEFVLDQVEPGAKVYTDEHAGYRGLPNHQAVNHSVGKYVDGMAHTQGIESHWAMLKRGYHGTYHRMSAKHLQRYVNEFAGRHNQRSANTGDQMEAVVAGVVGRRLMYRDLTAKTDELGGSTGCGGLWITCKSSPYLVASPKMTKGQPVAAVLASIVNPRGSTKGVGNRKSLLCTVQTHLLSRPPLNLKGGTMPHSEYCNRRVQGALDTVDFQVREYEQILLEKDKEIALYKENRQLYLQLCHAYQQRIQELEGRLRGRGAMRRNWTMNQN